MTKLHQDDQPQPCFITDGPPSNDLPPPPHRTMNLPQILASLANEELAGWPGDLADAEREKRRKAGV
ncbi:hypothetical protein FYA99_14625 [Bordetella parapertussis]|uniref:Uncharacterized protein n=2 Tax=Bordetella parapertussis TaxID=519 RepID=Q7WAV0_BORPA|nr:MULTISPECIES: hypothetical protein [Bordetella]AOB38502.1 hypothetical protein BBB43_06345 [Bordetella parapertussis]AUL42489.1 hypothetical protein BTL54_06425 [Bordetella parapertussis]AWP63990.1 hypothetical protein B7P06_15630 [Bordetella parapertussis]AWP71493.1 hypothetical protein B7O99_15620 [Bordetella parapertussis]AWP88492.1 hypothetical protein B7P05_06425 [Bordetella parapertussis]